MFDRFYRETMAQAGSVTARLVILMAASVLMAIAGMGAVTAVSEYRSLTGKIDGSDELSGQELHLEAIALLRPALDSRPVQLFGTRETEIRDRLQLLELRVQHQAIIRRALDQIHQEDWGTAIQTLSGIPGDSFYRHRAELKLAETRQMVLESRLAAEQTARELAEETAAAMEQARLLAEANATEEARLRAVEEAAKKSAQDHAREQARLRAREESARQAAEQELERQRLAREAQTQRADQQEEARVLALAQTHPRIKAIVSGELKFYIDPLPPYASDGVYNAVEEIASSFSAWDPYGANVRRVYNQNSADLTISWVRDYGSHILGESIFKANVKVGLGAHNCADEWRAFDANTVKKVLWHELGHSMGFGHSNDPDNVMYYQTDSNFEVESEVSEIIAGGWYYTFPICGTGSYSYFFETEDPNTGFDLYVLPPGTDPADISRGSARVYLDCGQEGMHRYSGSCTVASGASIYISNTSYSSAIRLSGQIISRNDLPWPGMVWDPEAYQYDEAQLARYWNQYH